MSTKKTSSRLKQSLTLFLGVSLMFANLAAADQIVTYVHTDRLGNPVAKTNSNGIVVWRQTYTPYGEAAQQTEQDGPGFTGHRYDASTGLVYMQARYYDPKIGRFLSPDPVTFSPDKPQFFNRYWYANGNPYKYTDPDGRCAICLVIAARFIVGASIDIATQHFVEGKAWGDVDLGDAAVAGVVSTAIPGLGNLAKTGYQGAKVVGPAAKAIAKIASKSANTANKAAKNAAGIARNVQKIKGAAADVGKAAIVAGAHQGVKAVAQSKAPEVKASDVQKAIEPPPPPPREDELHQ
ncbi:MAG TPA: RHS repeat-associated core domain-containing protein [Gammaproteobacteria bacterium]|nr:RHS repeat-associated core domain-containing protein [Gammaproteobacteria bacterium]